MRLILNEGGKLSDIFIKKRIRPDMPCGGNGTCGKCKVRFVSNAPSATDADKRLLSEEELSDGWRLSCRAVVEADTEIEVPDEKCDKSSNSQTKVPDEMSDKGDYSLIEGSVSISDEVGDFRPDKSDSAEGCGIAIDIGTTTIVAELIDYKEGIVKKSALMNSGKVFGADVISRIKAANEGEAQALQKLMIEDINSLINELIYGDGLGSRVVSKPDSDGNLDSEAVSKPDSGDFLGSETPLFTECDEKNGSEEGRIQGKPRLIIAGNTTMQHILMGDSCEGLGRAPYKPSRLSYPVMRTSELLKSDKCPFPDSECMLMPGISAFVGGDIVSGMYALSFDSIPEGKRYMLIDLGTNAEMAVADSERIIVCSAAAGPVFEGGGISCGMAGVHGAVEHVNIRKNEDATVAIDIDVIGGGIPQGICGSGVLEIVSELKRTEMIDETGLYDDEYFEEGFPFFSDANKTITFSQNDIRQVQLAKAAIRSGIDTLLDAAGLKPGDIDKVYLAGGFSDHLDIDKIRYLKILPEEFLIPGVAECVGNTSLSGCKKALMSDNSESKIREIINKARELTLANTDTFSESFIEAMNF